MTKVNRSMHSTNEDQHRVIVGVVIYANSKIEHGSEIKTSYSTKRQAKTLSTSITHKCSNSNVRAVRWRHTCMHCIVWTPKWRMRVQLRPHYYVKYQNNTFKSKRTRHYKRTRCTFRANTTPVQRMQSCHRHCSVFEHHMMRVKLDPILHQPPIITTSNSSAHTVIQTYALFV